MIPPLRGVEFPFYPPAIIVILWKFRGAVEFINSLVVLPPLTVALTLVNCAAVIGFAPVLFPPFY